jgi:hypothetical protein
MRGSMSEQLGADIDTEPCWLPNDSLTQLQAEPSNKQPDALARRQAVARLGAEMPLLITLLSYNNLIAFTFVGSRDSSVGIAAERSESRVLLGASRPAPGPTCLISKGYRGAFPGRKAAGV